MQQAILPIGCAVGGMIVPALFYLFFNQNTPYEGGWGIPMATDIAFSLGVASILGSRVPVSLKIFLTALAIIDDLGAILVIALFYGGGVKAIFLLGAALVVISLWLLNRKAVPFGFFHIMLGITLWYFISNSGIHATIAGVIFAFMVPIEKLPELEHKLHHYVNFGILPLFAIANTAILIKPEMLGQINSTLSFGILAVLFLGKPVGVLLATWVMVKTNISALPPSLNWSHMVGAGILAGIGFTMSIFINCLAFEDTGIQDLGKIVILIGTLLSLLAATCWFVLFTRNNHKIASE